jgi:predicted phage terminase large subunit-like protein
LFLDQWRKREVFFGGAAGGGKSVALLMGALDYVQTPGYAALILRKDFARLELAGGLIPMSHVWFRETDATWVASRRQWIFPNKEKPGLFPATIMFGYLNRPLDKFRYASSEFQYIAFDELTDFTEEDYLFLFSRLRRNTSVKVPLRMRSASNPGGPGHAWVKERFIGGEPGDGGQEPGECGVGNSDCGMDALSEPCFRKQGRIYIPSRIEDNEHLDAEEYRQSLLHLPAVERERLMHGDWSVQKDGLIQAEWLRYYVETDKFVEVPRGAGSGDPRPTGTPGQMELLEPSGKIVATIPEGACYRFVTIDPAGTSAERTQELRGREASWSVVQVWDQPRGEVAKFLLLRHQERRRVGFSRLCDLIREVRAAWRPERVFIEGEKLGRAVQDILYGEMPIQCVSPGVKDKATRAGPLIVKLEQGEVFLPKYNTTWRPKFEAELLAWTGDERQAADQIDAAAYAAIVVGERKGGTIRVMRAVRS